MNTKIYKAIKKILKRDRNWKSNEIDYENAKVIIKNDEEAILLDVRSPQEYKEGHLEGSINIPIYDLTKMSENIIKNKKNTIIVYCQSGNRSKKAIEELTKKGYENLYDIKGGLDNI